MNWRPMTLADVDAVHALADRVHQDHPEDRHVFEERLSLYPPGCHVLEGNGRLLGYALTHPWRLHEPPALNTLLGALPQHPTTYYIHDVALHPVGRGKGQALAIGEALTSHAKASGFGNVSLVAVNGSQAFWERLGFQTEQRSSLEKKLSSYGSDAVLMVRRFR